MGHSRLGVLPWTRKWDEVVKLIERDGDTVELASAAEIASAALNAAEKGSMRAADDEGVGRATWLLTQLPLAARDPAYTERLKDLGLEVSDKPSLPELLGAFSDAIDSHMRQSRGRTDLGEMAQMAAGETLASVLGSQGQGLFGTTPDDVRHELGSLATTTQFGTLARQFFGNLTRRYLEFFLSRELSNHVGGARRFASISEHSEFDKSPRKNKSSVFVASVR